MNDALFGLLSLTVMVAVLGFYLLNKGINGIRNKELGGKIVTGMGFLFFMFGLWMGYAAFQGVAALNEATPCEWVVANATTTANTTSYEYKSTCADTPQLPGIKGLLTAYSWLFYLLNFMVFGLLCVLFYREVIAKW